MTWVTASRVSLPRFNSNTTSRPSYVHAEQVKISPCDWRLATHERKTGHQQVGSL